MKIWIDADACPAVIKEIVFKASERLSVEVCLVANQELKIPKSALISMVKVAKGFDVADAYIVTNLNANDMVITADVPLAALVVEKGALAINPRGELYNEGNISERLSVRNFMQSMRESGLIQGGGPAQFNPADKQRFASTFDKHLHILLKKDKK
ncbi:YaiI/YqxD family protein [Fluviispira vulneris]|uniref:YaiI/YqxD family protein n=1 Tax=Fluviispira vulneris TaxID=2763012 RepID=UPI001647FD30|nr:YaiI/YqxD family protein [Fluviispira vulneris]